MSYKMRIEPRGDYLYFYVTGRETLGACLGYWKQIVNEYAKHDYTKILVEENLKGRLTVIEMYEVVSDFASFGVNKIPKIAFIDRHEVNQERNKFGELVTRKREVNCKVFPDIDAAERWLNE